MVKLIFRAYKKSIKIFFVNFISIYKNDNRILSKKQRKASKEARETNQNLSEEKKTKSINMLMNDKEIFLKKEKTKSANMAVKDIEFFQKMKNKKLVEYRKKYSKMQKIKTG